MNRRVNRAVEDSYNHQSTEAIVNGSSLIEKARPMTTEGKGRGVRQNKDVKKRIMSSGASGRISSNNNPRMSEG